MKRRKKDGLQLKPKLIPDEIRDKIDEIYEKMVNDNDGNIKKSQNGPKFEAGHSYDIYHHQ